MYETGDLVRVDPSRDPKGWEELYGEGIWKVVLKITSSDTPLEDYYHFDVVYDPEGVLDDLRDDQPIRGQDVIPAGNYIQHMREELQWMKEDLGV